MFEKELMKLDKCKITEQLDIVTKKSGIKPSLTANVFIGEFILRHGESEYYCRTVTMLENRIEQILKGLE